MLGISSSLVKGGASLLTFVKDNLKLYLDFKSNKSDTLKFPSEGSTSFDGSDDNIAISHSSDLSFGTNPHTISAWAKLDVLANFKTIISKRQAGGTATDYNLSVGANGIVYTYNGSATAQTATGVISTGSWFHYALVYDGSAYQLYINGSAVAWASGTTTSGASNSHDVAIGWDRTGNYWDGQIANVALWSRELSPEEIQSIQNKSYSQLKGVEETSLVAWWALDSETASGRTPIEQNAKTETAPQEAENKIVLNSHGTTTYTQILNESDRTFASQGNWVQGSGTFEFGNTDVYSEGALKISSAGWVYLATNGSGFDTALVSGNIYKIQFTWTVVDTSHAQNFWFGIDSSFGSYGLWRRYQFNTDQLPEAQQVVTIYHQHDGGNYFYFRNTASSSCEFHIKNISCELIGNNVGISNATTTTSVYGGNAPILPRAVDVAKEGQADNIGNGSASFNGSSDRISFSPLSITGDASFTISAWIKPDTILGGNTVVVFGDDDTTDSAKRVALYFNAGKPYFAFWGSDVLHNSSVIQANEWQHFAITYSGGNTTTANSAIYLNGVSLSLTGGTASPLLLENDIFQIGADHNPSQYFDGLISQVGIWRGALTQSQIQSVFESTSYSKIPADVKSTLGSELFDADASTFDSGTHSWVVYGSNTVTNDSGALKITYVNDARGAYLWLKDASDLSSDLTIGKTYKFTFDAKVSSGASVDVTISTLSGLPQVITETSFTTKSIYFTAENTTTTYIDTRNMGSGEIIYLDNLSLKEVINDIVAYYPLDGDNSANGVTQDVTTGEVLGDELLTNGGFDTDSNWTKGDGWTIANGVASSDETAQSTHSYLTQSVSFESGALYKVSYDLVYNDSAGNGFLVQFTGSGSPSGTGRTSSGSFVEYIRATANHTAFNFRSSDGTATGTVDNISLKKVLSNTGVLK